MIVYNNVQVVEVDGIKFTEDTLKQLVRMAKDQKSITVMRIDDKIYFKENTDVQAKG